MLKKIFAWFRKRTPPAAKPPGEMQRFLEMLAMTDEQEIACDDVLMALAEFGEMAQRGEDVTALMPLVAQHLDMCPDCREEYEALMTILEAEGEILGA
jgi:hypothetical protein